MKRVVITGMGVAGPNAENVASFNDMLRNGRSGIEFIPGLQELGFECQVGGIASLGDEISKNYYQYHELDVASSYIQLACKASMEAWLDAGLKVPDPEDQNVLWNTGVLIGTGIAAPDKIGYKVVKLTDSKRVKRLGGLITQNIMASGASAYLSAIFGLGNQSSGNSSACCSGSESIISGFYRIQSGYAERMIVGGSEGYSPYHWAGFDSMRILNKHSNDNPEAASRPLSVSARGFVPSSGSGILIIEELETARKRGAKIYAEILSGSINGGGHRSGGSMTYPNSEGVNRCIQGAVKYAGVDFGDIDLINAHLTGTKADTAEIGNWTGFYPKIERIPYINATKSMIGHTLGGAGALESIASILQLNGNYIHPNINSEDLHPEIEEKVPREKIPLEMKESSNMDIAIKASFGFGDINSVLIFKKTVS